MGHKNSAVHRGRAPGPHRPNINFRAEPDVGQAIDAWCAANGVDRKDRGVQTRALTALILAGRDALNLAPNTWPQPGRTTVRCTAANAVRTVDEAAWASDRALCPDCGAEARVWVRGSDLFPRAKIRPHRIPEGMNPADNGPYAVHPSGAIGLRDDAVPRGA